MECSSTSERRIIMSYISKIDPETLMSLYSIVFQDVTLFNNTVMENIRIGKKDAIDAEVIAAVCESI